MTHKLKICNLEYNNEFIYLDMAEVRQFALKERKTKIITAENFHNI